MTLWGTGFGELNEQYKLYPKDNSKGLLRTQQLYQENKDFFSDDYNFGYLTELYFNLQDGERDHWRNGVAGLPEIQAPIKSTIIAALTHQPDPIEIKWQWGGKPPVGIKKGVIIAYDSDQSKYFIGVFGYAPPLTEEQAQRLARRAERDGENKK
jgi:hypothetical protein